MSYTPTQWQSGDVVTAEKLNKLENGVANIFVIESTVSVVQHDGDMWLRTELGYSYNEIAELFDAGKIIVLRVDYEGQEDDGSPNAFPMAPIRGCALLNQIEHTGGGYVVRFSNGSIGFADCNFYSDSATESLYTDVSLTQ